MDAHTGGEPFRLVVDGLPDIAGSTILERRAHARESLDWLRKALMWEPRGHADMYGGWVVPPERPDSELGILFTHNEGFSTMCGHGIIALAKIVIETGLVEATGPERVLAIDTPAGRVVSTSSLRDGSVTETRFENVPSFAPNIDQMVTVPGMGDVRCDIAFGGAFYALVDSEPLGLDLADAGSLISAGRRIKSAITDSVDITHPEGPEMSFLYGVIFTGPAATPGHHSRNVCVFADGEVDRSPTGTGVSARLAAMHAKGEIVTGEALTIESIVGSTFRGRVLRETEFAGFPAVVPEVSGTAHLVGRSEVWVDPDDELGGGFLIR